MRADEVVEEDEQGNEVVGRSKGRKTLLGFVPSLELVVEALNKVVGNVIVETLDADVLDPMQRLNRHLIGEVAVAHNGQWSLQKTRLLSGVYVFCGETIVPERLTGLQLSFNFTVQQIIAGGMSHEEKDTNALYNNINDHSIGKCNRDRAIHSEYGTI